MNQYTENYCSVMIPDLASQLNLQALNLLASDELFVPI